MGGDRRRSYTSLYLLFVEAAQRLQVVARIELESDLIPDRVRWRDGGRRKLVDSFRHRRVERQRRCVVRRLWNVWSRARVRCHVVVVARHRACQKLEFRRTAGTAVHTAPVRDHDRRDVGVRPLKPADVDLCCALTLSFGRAASDASDRRSSSQVDVGALLRSTELCSCGTAVCTNERGGVSQSCCTATE